MQRHVVLCELFAVSVLSCVTLCLQVFIYRQKSPRLIWKTSPALCLFFLSTSAMAIQDFCLASQWILFGWGVVENIAENTFFLLVVAHVGLVLRQFHNCATIALFAQRVYHLLLPTKRARTFNHIVISIVLVFFFVGASGATYNMAINSISDRPPVPEGMVTLFALVSMLIRVFFLQLIFTVCITIVIMIIGSYMLYLLKKYKKNKQTTLHRKENKFALYVFYVRFVCETVPFFIDVMLSNTVHIDLGKYIGPFGALGSALDFTTKTFVYFMLARKHKISSVILNKNTP
uniref:Serpentine Receptor, class BC (Class B-like) n=1 Tax=Steinernema glaseri TaxID=37863 RepID=A0A1I7Y5Z7_9BILA